MQTSIFDFIEEETTENDINSEEYIFTKNILDILNKLETIWKGTLEIDSVSNEVWGHISSKNKNLHSTIKTKLNTALHYGNENCFIRFNNQQDTIKFNDEVYCNDQLRTLTKNKNFSLAITPNKIHIFYHNFDNREN